MLCCHFNSFICMGIIIFRISSATYVPSVQNYQVRGPRVVPQLRCLIVKVKAVLLGGHSSANRNGKIDSCIATPSETIS